MSFFQALQAALAKQTSSTSKTPEQLNAAIRQLVSKVITTEGQVIDVITAAELLEKLLKDELKVCSKRNLVQSQVFSEKLKKALNTYHNRAITTAEVIEALIALAKELDAATKRGESLAANDSALQAMGDTKLKVIAAELITQVKKSVTIDWTLRESARARIRVMLKRILNRYGYPPDLQEEAVKTVLAQAALLCAAWV